MNDKIQNAINHVEQTIFLANDPKFLKKIKYSGEAIASIAMIVSAFGMSFLFNSFFSHAGFLALFALIVSFPIGFGVAWWSNSLVKKARHNYLTSHYGVSKYELSPASNELKLSILRLAQDMKMDDVLFTQLAAVSERTDVPSGWWGSVSTMLKNERKDTHQEEIQIFEELKILQSVEDNSIKIQSPTKNHMNI